jgi:hypothetical protein
MGLVAYYGTGGDEGRPGSAFAGFALIAVVQWMVRGAWIPYPSRGDALVELLACAIAVGIGLCVNSRLDEMAGMVYLLIPVMAIGVLGGGHIFCLLRKLVEDDGRN